MSRYTDTETIPAEHVCPGDVLLTGGISLPVETVEELNEQIRYTYTNGRRSAWLLQDSMVEVYAS